jgi:hypothetical protein
MKNDALCCAASDVVRHDRHGITKLGAARRKTSLAIQSDQEDVKYGDDDCAVL